MVQFYLWLKFYFPLFLGMLMYDNEYDANEKKILTKDKLHDNIQTLYLEDAGSWLQSASRQETFPFCTVLSSHYRTKYLAN